MRLLFQKASIFTSEDERILRDGILAVDGEKIAYVGPPAEPWISQHYDRVIDASGKLLLPGFVNTHSHLAMTLLRGRGSGRPLREWLEQAIWPVEDRFTEEDYYTGVQMAVAEMLLSGITCFCDMYMGMDQTARVMQETGMRGILSRGIVSFSRHELEPKLKENIDLYERYHGKENGRILVFLGPHAEYTNTEETLRIMARAASELGCGLHVHVSETRSEHRECIERHGQTPVRVLEKAGFFDNPVVCAHCVFAEEEDLRILADAGAGVSHNPSSNLKLGSGIAPVPSWLKIGLRAGLGTDGAASNDRMDLLREANLAALMISGSTENPSAVTAAQMLRMATLGGAEALGLDKRIGSLKAGKQADLVMLDISGPRYAPQNELLNHLLYSSDSSDIRMTMIDGKILMEDRRLCTLDLEDVMRRFSVCAERLMKDA